MKGKAAFLGVTLLLAAALPAQAQRGGRAGILHHGLHHPQLHHHVFFHRIFVLPIFFPFVPIVSPVIVVVPQPVAIQIPAGLEAEADQLQGSKSSMPLADLNTEQGPEGPQVEGQSGWLGVMISEVSGEKARELELPAERGVLVTEVKAESPAAKAGLRANDVIIEFNDQRLEGTLQLRRLVRETPPGRTVQLAVWRDARAQTLSILLGSLRTQKGTGIRVSGPHYEKPDVPSEWRASTKPTPSSPPLTLLVFKDNSIYAVTDYWLVNGQLHYTTSYVGETAVPVEQIDLETTVQLNWKRGTKFVLRPKASAR